MHGHTTEGAKLGLRELIDPSAPVGTTATDIEQWYGVPYHRQKYESKDLARWYSLSSYFYPYLLSLFHWLRNGVLTSTAIEALATGFEIPKRNLYIPYELLSDFGMLVM